jgi:hypothetical protein
VLLLGLGGIWVEALGDVKRLPVDADETQIVEALHKLRAQAAHGQGAQRFPRRAASGHQGVAQVVMAIARVAIVKKHNAWDAYQGTFFK